MQNKHPIITYGYYFFSEAIIVFLLTLPIINIAYQWKPHLLYLTLVLLITFLFSLLRMRNKQHGIFMVTGGGIFGLFFICGFPFALATFFAIILTWRYIHIQGKKDIERERVYVIITLFLSVFHIVVYGENIVFIIAFLQLLFGITCHMIRHLVTIEKDNRKQFNFHILMFIVLAFLIGAGGLLFISNYIKIIFRTIWSILSTVIAFIFSLPVYFLQFMGFYHNLEFDPLEKLQTNGEDVNGQNGQQQTVDSSFIELNEAFFYWIIIITVLIAIILLIIRHFKKRLPELSNPTIDYEVTYEHLPNAPYKKKWPFFSKSYTKASDHPIRKLVHQFEKRAAKKGSGRKSFETLEEWLTRIGFQTNLQTYQLVRYGEGNVTERDRKQLKAQLKRMTELLEEDR